MDHRFAGFNEGGKVEHGVKRLVTSGSRGKDGFEGRTVSQLAQDELDPGRKQVAPAMTQIIKNDWFMPVSGKHIGNGTTYVPCASGYQDFHKKYCPFVSSLGNLKSITVVSGQTAGRLRRYGLPHLPLGQRSHEEDNHVTGGRRASLMPPFRDRKPESPVAVEESGILLQDALDANWRSTIIRGVKESRATASSGSSLTTRQLCGFLPLTAINENMNRMIPLVCTFEQSIPGHTAGCLKIETGSDMRRATWIGSRKPTPKQKGVRNGASNGFSQPSVESFCVAKAA
jgi:hypothetical protein